MLNVVEHQGRELLYKAGDFRSVAYSATYVFKGK
jgi:hypothetical protein